jgi:hypothetical protein
VTSPCFFKAEGGIGGIEFMHSFLVLSEGIQTKKFDEPETRSPLLAGSSKYHFKRISYEWGSGR